jgi:hypothetical protein
LMFIASDIFGGLKKALVDIDCNAHDSNLAPDEADRSRWSRF